MTASLSPVLQRRPDNATVRCPAFFRVSDLPYRSRTRTQTNDRMFLAMRERVRKVKRRT